MPPKPTDDELRANAALLMDGVRIGLWGVERAMQAARIAGIPVSYLDEAQGSMELNQLLGLYEDQGPSGDERHAMVEQMNRLLGIDDHDVIEQEVERARSGLRIHRVTTGRVASNRELIGRVLGAPRTMRQAAERTRALGEDLGRRPKTQGIDITDPDGGITYDDNNHIPLDDLELSGEFFVGTLKREVDNPLAMTKRVIRTRKAVEERLQALARPCKNCGWFCISLRHRRFYCKLLGYHSPDKNSVFLEDCGWRILKQERFCGSCAFLSAKPRPNREKGTTEMCFVCLHPTATPEEKMMDLDKVELGCGKWTEPPPHNCRWCSKSKRDEEKNYWTCIGKGDSISNKAIMGMHCREFQMSASRVAFGHHHEETTEVDFDTINLDDLL